MTKFIKTAPDIQLAYEVQGEGLPIIIIHGLRASKENMWPLGEALSKNYQVYRYDVRGHGESTHPQTLSWQDHIDDLHHFMAVLNIHKAIIIGHSMGSYIALSFALQYPQYVLDLVLIASKLEGKQSSTSRILEQLNLDITQLSSQQLTQVMDGYMYVPETMATTKQLARQLKSPIKLSKHDVQLANEAMRQYDVKNNLHQLMRPTLVIVGQQDGINDIVANRELVKYLRNGYLEVIEDASHMIQLEQPFKLATAIHQFIGEYQ